MAKATVRRIKSDYIRATQKGVQAGVIAVAKQGQAISIKKAPHDTGALRGSIQVKSLGKYKAIWFTNLIYNKIQEYGGTIKAKSAKALVFLSKKTGQWVTVKSVYVPPTPYMRPSANILKSRQGRMYKALMHKAYTKMSSRRE